MYKTNIPNDKMIRRKEPIFTKKFQTFSKIWWHRHKVTKDPLLSGHNIFPSTAGFLRLNLFELDGGNACYLIFLLLVLAPTHQLISYLLIWCSVKMRLASLFFDCFCY
jgi:hypothetical protein